MATYYSPKIITNGLVACLDAANTKCYPRSGATVVDLSGNVGAFTGNASYIDSNNGFASGASWSCNSTDVLNTDTHSIFFKIRFNSTATYTNATSGNWDKIFTYAPSGTDRSPGIWRYPSNRIIHWRYDSGNSGVDITATAAGYYFAPGTEFSADTWYYVGTTKNNDVATAYVNGVKVGSGTVTSPKVSGNAAIILYEGFTSTLSNMDNVMVYNRVLSPDEVIQNYNALKSRFGL